MKNEKREKAPGVNLALKSCAGRPARSMTLTALSIILCFCILAGALLLIGLRTGLQSLDERLGADIMVVPYQASVDNYLEDAILMGNSGYYYMSASKMDDIRNQIDGIEKVSGQLFLVTTTSSCCSYKVSLVGFDPETDFTITPWVESSYQGEIQDGEIFVGHSLAAYAGDVLKFFGTELTVAARLDKTGTYLDTAVYMNMDTARALVEAAKEKGLFAGANSDAASDDMISCILVKLRDGYSAETALGQIKTYISKIAAVKTETTVENVSDKLAGIRNIAAALIVVVWILMLVIEFGAFTVHFSSQTKDFAILRVMGASRRKLSGLVMRQALLLSGVGSVIGAVAATLVMLALSGHIGSSLDMPFLLPSAGGMAGLIVGAIAVSVLGGILAALAASRKAGSVDAAAILNGER